MTDEPTNDDLRRLHRIAKAITSDAVAADTAVAELIAYYRDYERAVRTSHQVMMFHLGFTLGLCERLMKKDKAHTSNEDIH